MAKKSVPKKPKQMDFTKTTWVLNNLRPEELAHMDENPPTVAQIWGWLADMVERDWKVSMKWDYHSQAYLVSLVNLAEGNDEAGYAFSGRSDDLEDAMVICWYKYNVVAEGNLIQLGAPIENKRG